MLRELMTNSKSVDATFKAAEAMKRGMLVVKNIATGEAELPAAYATNLYFVTKETIPSGENSLYEISEYDKVFEEIKADELVKLVKPEVGELYASNQVTGTPAKGDDLVVLADGTIGVIPTQAADYTIIMQCAGERTENGNKLYEVAFITPKVVTVSA